MFWGLRCLLCLVILSISADGRRTGTTSSCQEMIAKATKRRKIFTSPNYPNEFAEQTQCRWIVQAPSGYRVRISFKSFYLIGATMVKGCTRQKLKIVDMYTGMIDGPYCGNTQPPDAVSAGQGFRIILESNAVGVHDTYRGFQIVYHVTTAPPSERMRDLAGQWRNYQIARDGFTLAPQTVPTPTRGPNEIDENDNAAIDAVNNQVNKNANSHNVVINKNNNEQGVVLPDAFDDGRPVRPNRRIPPTRIHAKTPPRRTTVNWPKQPPPVPPRNRSDDKKKQDSLPGGAIAGIIIAIIVALVIVFLILYWNCVKRKRTKTKGKEMGRNTSPSGGSRYSPDGRPAPSHARSPHKNQELPRPRPPVHSNKMGRAPRTRPYYNARPHARVDNRAHTQHQYVPRGYGT